MYILYCTQKRRYFIMSMDAVNGQGSCMVHIGFDAYTSHVDFPLIESTATRIKPHLSATIGELYRRIRSCPVDELRGALSDQLYRLSRRLKTQRNEMESGFLEGLEEDKHLKRLAQQHEALENVIGIRKPELYKACRLKELVLEPEGWKARFGFDETGASDIFLEFAFDQDGRILMEEGVEHAA